MARSGLTRYSPKRATAARYRKRTPGPKAAAKLARREAARGRLPKPGTAAAKRIMHRFLPDTAENRWLRDTARGETLSRQGPGHYSDELNERIERAYRAAYAARQRERQAAGRIKPRAKAKPGKVRVRAHWRRVPR